MGLNPFEIRASLKLRVVGHLLASTGLNPFEIRASLKLANAEGALNRAKS